MSKAKEMQVPILRISYDNDSNEYLGSGLKRILDSGVLTDGPFTRSFEEEFAAFSGASHAVAVSSGTAALEVIIRALGLYGRSIIVPTNTFIATALAVIHAGNRVIFADCDSETFALSASDVESRIEDDTAAVVLVHIGGVITPEYTALQRLCAQRGLYLIEDCAHAHGCTIGNQPAGGLGVAGAFSFFPTKVITTGEGGIITTNDEGLAQEVRQIRNQGKNPDKGNAITGLGHNFRISEVTALLGAEQMRRAERLITERQRVARFYDDGLKGYQGLRPLKLPKNLRSSYYKYIIYLNPEINRAELKRVMREEYKVALTGEVYAELCHEAPLWQSYRLCGAPRTARCACWPRCDPATRVNGFPGSQVIAADHACLPVYPGLTDIQLATVLSGLENYVRSL